MDNRLENLLLSLDDEIGKKCFEIKQKRKEKALHRFFAFSCVLFVVLPFSLVLMGVNFLAFFIPAAIFQMVSLIAFILLYINNIEKHTP